MKSETVPSALLMKIERSTYYQCRGVLEVHDDKETAFSAVHCPSRNDSGGDLHNRYAPPRMREDTSCGSGDSRCLSIPRERDTTVQAAWGCEAHGVRLTTHGRYPSPRRVATENKRRPATHHLTSSAARCRCHSRELRQER
ncbi:Hypp1092 [Branchiostoma lanceolatum]|uniref:Hypp1092 protein n=1 Tax=Branchiostoma lanceolatum TaxID=7740 RepID=A0A8J9ZGB2_BRALA|nr:Hypp1092 [Branchiostoma lanceolatum]